MNIDPVTLYIPIKKSSTRVKDKTGKPFYKGKNLFEIKLKQALRLFPPEQVILTTDCEQNSHIAQDQGISVQWIDDLSKHPWRESLKKMLAECRNPFFCLYRATTPFLDEGFLQAFLETFFSEKQVFDSAVTVLKIQERLFDQNSCPLNFSIGSGHLDSQDTAPIFKEICGISIISKELAQNYGYHYGKRPKLFVVDQLHGTDINEEEDWKAAQTLTEIPSFQKKL